VRLPERYPEGVGKVGIAEGGTLFLDEVADLTADAQARLLRFLHDRGYERLGDPTERRADVRLITATNRPLEEEIKAGRFREDLLFRLNVIALTVPALRERREDILPLAAHYLRFFERQQARQHLSFSSRCENAIVDYLWPGNLRELRNAVERAVILSPASILEPQDLGLEACSDETADETASNGQGTRRSETPILGEDFLSQKWSVNTLPGSWPEPRPLKRRPKFLPSIPPHCNAGASGTVLPEVWQK
jgi:DNA-binding NtrC family response regulator